MSGSNCCFLNCIQISQEVGQVVWYSHLFKNFPHLVVIHTVKGFITVNEAEVLEFSWFIYDPTNDGNLTSGSSAFSKSSLYIWKFLVHLLLKPSLGHFEHYFANMWNECHCEVVWTFFGIALLLDWKLTFSSPVATAVFSKFADILSTALSAASSFRIWNSSAGIPSSSLALFVVMLPKAHLTSHSRMSALGKWPHHCGYLAHSVLFFFVYFFCVFLPHLINLFCFCPLSCSSFHEIVPWQLQFSWRDL